MTVTATVFPLDYGCIPETGDALDALVVCEAPTLPGCRIRCRLPSRAGGVSGRV